MVKKSVWLLACIAFASISLMLSAEGNRFGVEWDAEAVANMSNDERLAYQRAYKAALEDAARRAGWVPGQKAQAPTGRVAPVPENLVPGSMITYHSGALSPSTGASVAVGNQFDTALTVAGTMCPTDCGPVEMSGSITMFTVDMAAVGGGVAFVSFFDQQTNTSANGISSMTTPLVTGVNTNTLASPVNYVGTSFLAGIWNFTVGTDTVNVATGTVGGQCFHGMSINDVVATGFNRFTATNGAFAVQGDVATPVELMNFSVD